MNVHHWHHLNNLALIYQVQVQYKNGIIVEKLKYQSNTTGINKHSWKSGIDINRRGKQWELIGVGKGEK